MYSLALILLGCGARSPAQVLQASRAAGIGTLASTEQRAERMEPRFGEQGRCYRSTNDASCARHIAPYVEAARADDGLEALTTLVDVHSWLRTRNAPVLDAPVQRADVASRLLPDDPFELYTWNADMLGMRVPGVTDPHWDGEVLVYDELGFHPARAQLPASITGYRVRITFTEDGWTMESDDLSSEPLDDAPFRERVVRAFSGPVHGYVRVTMGSKRALLLGVHPGEGARPLVLREGDGATASFATWAELIAAKPDLLADPEPLFRTLLVEFGDRNAGGYTLIEDGDAYRAEYTKNGWNERRLTVRHDDVEVTRYTVPEMDAVAAPRIDDEGVAVGYFADGSHQPCRLEARLHHLPEVSWRCLAKGETYEGPPPIP